MKAAPFALFAASALAATAGVANAVPPRQTTKASPLVPFPSDEHYELPMMGWAQRLNVEEEAAAYDAMYGHLSEDHTAKVLDYHREEAAYFDEAPMLASGISLAVMETAQLGWHWLSQKVFGSTQRKPAEVPVLKTQPNAVAPDAPKFVVYGDSWVQNNSFGVPDPKSLKGFTHFNIAFLLANAPADNALEWTWASDAQRKAIVKAYNDAGIRIGVALFGETDRPQSNGNDPIKLAQKMAAYVKKYQLQGADVDYEEFDLMNQQKATRWLIPFTRELRRQLPQGQYYMSHAPVAPWFNRKIFPLAYAWVHERVGDQIDFYNVQFYNQDNYRTCDELIWNASGYFELTSVFEIAKYAKVPLNKIVVGKPSRPQDAANGYMTPQLEGQCLKIGRDNGWNGGIMFWEYKGSLVTKQLATVKGIAGFV